MLCDYTQVKNLIGLPPGTTDTTLDAKIQLVTVAADATVKDYCKQRLETSVITEYPILLGGTSICLNEKYAQSYRLTGNIVNGLATITGLSSTSNLLVGMPVLQAIVVNSSVTTQPFPNGTTIQSVDSSSQVTLTNTCTAASQNGVLLDFGLALWYDPNGYYGDGIGSDPAGPFGPATLLRQGLDFALQRDNPNDISGNVSKSSKLICLGIGSGLVGMVGTAGFYGGFWGDGVMMGGVGRGGLSARLPPLWPRYPQGAVKAVYAAGLGAGASAPNGLMPSSTTIPSDLTMATALLGVWMWRNADTGGMLVPNESYQGYSGSVAPAIDALKTAAELGSIRQILSRYRRLAA